MPDQTRTGTDHIDVSYVAHLARLHLTDEETRTFQAQLEQVIGYVHKLDELDVSGIEPTSHAHPVQNVFRRDEVREGLDPEQVQRNAPALIEGHFKVPKIVE